MCSILAGCGTQSQYTAPQDPSAASLHIETSSNPELYNSRVHFRTKNAAMPIFVGYINSAVIGTERGRNYLDTKVAPDSEMTASIYSAVDNDIGVTDILLETVPCFLRTVRFCEVSVTFTPKPLEQYIISQNADGLPCKISIYRKKDGALLPIVKAHYSHVIFNEHNQQVSEQEPQSNVCFFEKNKSLERNSQ